MSMTQRCPDNGVLCAELDSVLKSNFSSKPEWEDPLQRKVKTTFKVVPSKKQKSHDPELALDVPEQCQVTVEENPESEASPEATDNHTETEEDSYSPDRSDTETPLPSQELSAQEIQATDGPDSPPPPHDLDSQDCTGSPLSEDGDNDEGQKQEEDEPKVTSEVTAAVLSDRSDEELTSDCQNNSEDQSEFLLSPSGQSVSTDMDQCGSYTDEKEVEEELVQEEEDDNFPTPPPPVFFDEGIEVIEEGQEDTTTSSLPSSHPTSPTCNGQTNAFSEDRQDESTSAMSDQSSAAPKPLDKMSAAPSRFAQAVASRLKSHGKAPQWSTQYTSLTTQVYISVW